MRILHLLKTSVGATWALRQMRELVKLGVTVHAAMPPGPLVNVCESHGINVHKVQLDFPVKNFHKIYERAYQLQQLVKLVQPDIIHSHFVGTTLMMRLALGRQHFIPRIFQVPGPLHLEHSLFRYLDIQSAGVADHWISSCHWTYNTYSQAGIARNRLFHSHYGTDIEQFKVLNKGILRAELSLDKNVCIVGMVAYMYGPKRYLGQTRGLKGHEDLIDALSICIESGINLIGVFVGGAWGNATDYEQKVRQYGKQRCGRNIVFLGSRSDVPALYPDFDVAVHPSHSENLGGAAESLLIGVPTIATNVGGFPDIVQPGRTGWLVPPKSPTHLASAIKEAIIDPVHSHQIASNGKKLAQQVLDVRKTAVEVSEIYNTILTQSSALTD